MPPCPLGCCFNVTHARGTLQFFASSTAAFELPGSRVGRAALMSAGISTSRVDSSPMPAGLSPLRRGNTVKAAIPAIASPPAIPIRVPREPGFLPRGGWRCPPGWAGETSCCASGSLMFRAPIHCWTSRLWPTADVRTTPLQGQDRNLTERRRVGLPSVVFRTSFRFCQGLTDSFCHKATARNVR